MDKVPIMKSDFETFDHELHNILELEHRLNQSTINLIASENYTSQAVMQCQGSTLTNKYAEGYPGKRYYGGCEYIDQVENLAIDRANLLFSSDYANVQPHSGSTANAAVFFGLLNPGDTILGMELSHGGHLTHGSPVNFSGKYYKVCTYGLLPDGSDIDYDQVRAQARAHKPSMIIAGFSAFSGTLNWALFRDIADECGALLLADIAHVSGLIAAKQYPSPIDHADVITSTTHKTLRGPRGGIILAKRRPELFSKINFGLFPMAQGGPLMHIIAAKALAFKEALQPDFISYQQQVIRNARALAKYLKEKDFKIIGNSIDNHIILIDLTHTQITGNDAQQKLEKAGIIVNKNAIPNDPLPPQITSGIRIGTAAVTTQGLKEEDMKTIANWIYNILFDHSTIDSHRADISAWINQFYIYANI